MANLLSGTRIYGTGTVDTQLLVNGTTAATSTITGALRVVGGAGIGGSLFVQNTATILSTNSSTSTTSGALIVQGGVGVGGNLNVGGIINSTANTLGTTTTGALNYGALSYADNNNLLVLQTSTSSYAQLIIQNTSAGAAASADITISNNLGTANTYYANFGINSSAYSGTGSFNLPNASYVASQNGDMVFGSYSNNSIRFVLNSNTTDSMTISTASNSVIINSSATIANTATSLSTTTGALTVVGGVGVGGSVYVGNRIGWTSATNISAVYQVYNSANSSLDTVFG